MGDLVRFPKNNDPMVTARISGSMEAVDHIRRAISAGAFVRAEIDAAAEHRLELERMKVLRHRLFPELYPLAQPRPDEEGPTA